MYILDPEYIVKIRKPDIFKAEVTSGRSGFLFLVFVLFFVQQNWFTYFCYFLSIFLWSYRKILIYRSYDQIFIIQYIFLFMVFRRKVIRSSKIRRLLLGYYIPDPGSESTPWYELLFQTTDDKDILIARRDGHNVLNRMGKDISRYLSSEDKYVLMIE
jgi:hypothetical protein